MAYKSLVNKSCANRAAALTEIWTMIESMGWILHDNMDGSSYRVYKSNGELADRITEYVQIVWTTANRINMLPYYYWNNTTHAGLGGNTAITPYYLTTSELGFYLWCYGNKDLVAFWIKVSSTYYSLGFGHIPKSFWTLLTNLSVDALLGSNVSITVVATAGFEAGYSYQIIGNNAEGRDWVTVASITDTTHMIITNLPRSYLSGAKIGNCPSTFGMISNVNVFYPTCPKSAVGTADISSGGTGTVLITSTYVDPDTRLNKYVLCPIYWPEDDSTLFGYSDSYFLVAPATGMTSEDTFGVGQQDSGTSSGVNDSTHLNDTSKLWATNVWANKVVIITFGTGGGQIKKIGSNTGTQLTLALGTIFETTPDNVSQYVICDEGYRYFYQSGITAFAEGV